MSDSSFKILAVDDDPTVLTCYRQFFEEHELDIRTAVTYDQALEALQEQTSDVVILDVHMPFVDGLTLLDLLRAERPDIPVVFVTAQRREGLMEVLLEAGAYAVLHKPCSLATLLDCVTKAVADSGSSGCQQL